MNTLQRFTIAILLLTLSLLRATDSRPVSEEQLPHERHRRAGDLGTLTATQSGVLNEGHAPLTDCTALNDAGFSITGLYKVFPGDAEGEFTVFCDMDLLSGGWTIIQRRVDDSQSFDNNWDEYRNGFGDFNGNFWLGLHKIKRITDMGNYELYIGLEDFIARTVYSRYSSFSLGSEQSNYKLAIGAFQEAPVSTGGDSFSSHNTDPFSTPDKDNDVSSAHCAGLYKAGWWYKECHDSNLNGVYYPTGQIPGASHGIIWESWLTEFKPVKTAVMAVRRS